MPTQLSNNGSTSFNNTSSISIKSEGVNNFNIPIVNLEEEIGNNNN